MDKNSFLIYLDYEEQFNLLNNEEIGILMRAIIKYEKTREIPKLEGMVKMAFSFIKTQLDRDREKYNKKCEKNKENGLKGGRPKKYINVNDIKKKNTKKKFVKPNIEEIKEYCNKRKNNIDTQYFYDYYQSNGWKVGKNAMKDWQATIRTWERRNKSGQDDKEDFLNG